MNRFPIGLTLAEAVLPHDTFYIRLVSEWRQAQLHPTKTYTWETAARKFAEVNGHSAVLRADGSAHVFVKLEGKVWKFSINRFTFDRTSNTSDNAEKALQAVTAAFLDKCGAEWRRRRPVPKGAKFVVLVPKYSHAGSGASRQDSGWETKDQADAQAEYLRASGVHRWVSVEAR